MTEGTKKVVVNGQTYSAAPVVNDSIEYRSQETMEQLVTLVIEARESKDQETLSALKEFIQELPEIVEVVDFE